LTVLELAALPAPLAAIVRDHMDQQGLATPHLPFSKQVLAENLHTIQSQLGLAAGDIYFPVKTNDHPDVLAELYGLGAGFEIASAGELAILQQLGVPAARIIFGNPVKIESHLIAASGYGVQTFAFDTEQELQRIARHAPGSQVYLRIAVSNAGAEWQLAGKFGAPAGAALPLLEGAARLGLTPVGLSFHVGWNNTSLDAWQGAVAVVEQVAEQCLTGSIPIR
jgi:ornithine decarboxylase